MVKKLLPIALFCLLLTGCEDSDDPLARACAVERTPARNISLCLPTGWTLNTESFGGEESYIVFINEAGSGSVMQIHVKMDLLDAPVKSIRVLAERAVELARDTAPNYEVVSTEPVEIDRKQTVLHIFDAKPDMLDEPVRYYQLVTVHEGLAYGFTAVMKPEITDEIREILVELFKNIRFV